MASIPEPIQGLVLRYDFLRPTNLERGVENGKERPACVLLRLEAGDLLTDIRVVDEADRTWTLNYVATGREVLILPIQSDPPSKDQLGVVLSSHIPDSFPGRSWPVSPATSLC